MKNALSIIKALNHLHKFEVNKVLNKPSACAEYALALLEPRTGVTVAVWQSAMVFVRGVGAVAARSAARGPRSPRRVTWGVCQNHFPKNSLL